MFGRDWLKHIILNWLEIKAVVISKSQKNLNALYVCSRRIGDLYAKLTEKLDATPKFVKARHVPYTLKLKVETELEN